MTARLVLPPVPAVAVTTGLCELIPATVEWLRETWPCGECGVSGNYAHSVAWDVVPQTRCSSCDGRGWLVPSDARLDIWTDDTPPPNGAGFDEWIVVLLREPGKDGYHLRRVSARGAFDDLPVPAPNSFAGRVQVTGCLPIVEDESWFGSHDYYARKPCVAVFKDEPPLLWERDAEAGRDVSASAAWWPEGSFPVGGLALTVQGETQ